MIYIKEPTRKQGILGSDVPWLIFAISSIKSRRAAVLIRVSGESLPERGHSAKHLKEGKE